MAQVRIEVEINATPEEVRAVVLDFARYSEWHTSFMNALSTIPPEKDTYTLVPGDKISAGFSGNTVEPVITANTSKKFQWKGSTLMGAFAGEHYFEFRKSAILPGGTTFVHGENYDGWMTWMFGDWWLGVARGAVVRMYTEFAEDVKRRVETIKGIDTNSS